METYHSSSKTRAAQTSEPSLHTVRKPPAKPWNKKLAAPPPSNRPKVYKVNPIDFRELVQRLTGAPEQLTASPVPLETETGISSSRLELFPPPSETTDQKPSESGTATSSFGFDFLSPSTFNWCSFLSPGSLSGLEQSTAS